MGRDFWLVTLLVLLLLCVMSLNHFLPLLMNYSVLPRGSFGFPLVGETLAFLKPHTSTSIGAFLQNHCERYGKVFKSHLFLSPTVVSCDQELNNYILQNEDKLFQCSYPKPILGILGKHSLLVAVSDQHKKLRNVALSLIVTTKSKPQFINDVETIALQILNSWKDKDQVIFCQEARKYTFNVIVKQVLGLTPNEPETTQILQDFIMFMKGLVSLPLNIPGTPYARALQARNRISSTVKAIIRERKIDHDGNNNSSVRSNKRNRKDDFLEILVSMDSLTEDEKVSFVLDSLLGGYETTSLLMAMTVLFLGQSPPAILQLKQEHESIRMKKDGDFLSWEDYKRMGFTHKVINEALRFGNIVKFVHRKALKDIQFKDYVIPGGWKVLPVFSAVHLDPTLHADAFYFNPWRWENDETCKKFTPFGGGSRLCPGFELAKVEVAFFLHHLIQRYRWEIEDDQPIAYPYVEFTRGLKLNLHRCSSE